MENIYVQFEGMVYQQIVGFPMDTNCAPLIADLFLFCYGEVMWIGCLTSQLTIFQSYMRRHIDEKDFMSNLRKSVVMVNWLFHVTINDLSVIYVTAHI